MEMEELIGTINQLQEVFSVLGSQCLQLPQIVVVGTQSSGKSSVLENLVGRSFLPRGPGVVTRCPLVLQLVHTDEQTAKKIGADEYCAIFQHDKSKCFTDFSLISREIEKETERKAGPNKAICVEAIVLRIFSTAVLNLTLVDLPGLTKVPVADQPYNIENQIRDLILNYIKNPNTIILAVTPANTDMATSESLKIAREVDPNGDRTLAVVTKIDLMDEGTDAKDVLCGKVIPVRLGIVGVVNRSQKDTVDGKTINQSLKDEAAFFYTKYRNISNLQGTAYLSETVQSLLMNHIRKCLPNLKERIYKKLIFSRTELNLIGEEDKLDQPSLLLSLLTKFAHNYCSSIKGDYFNIQTKELCGGARINYIFQESLATALKSIDGLSGLTKGGILTAMQNASGASPTLFVPEVAFELLVKKQIKRLRGPCLQCVELVHEEMIRIVEDTNDDSELGFKRFSKLQQEMSKVVIDLLQICIPNTYKMVDNLLNIELAYINTAHPDFLPNAIHDHDKISYGIELNPHHPHQISSTMMHLSDENLPVPRHQNGDSLSLPSPVYDKRSRDCVIIQELIQSYFAIVRKNIQDIIPKTIMHFLVNYVVDHLQSELVSRLYRTDVNALLQESQKVIERREAIQIMIQSLKEAYGILNNIKSTRPNTSPKRS